MTKQTFNGWTNFETHNVKMWIDEGDKKEWYKMARNEDISILAEALQIMHEDLKPEVTGVYADLLNAALSEVNWREIAESLNQEANDYFDIGNE